MRMGLRAHAQPYKKMRDFLYQLRVRVASFMQGRYGMDAFSRFLVYAALACCVLSWIFGRRLFYWLAIALMVYSYVRIFSKNAPARYAENERYLQLKARALSFFGKKGKQLRQAKDYHIYKCPSCGQKIRIPRGKGRVSITCPKCRESFIRKS